MDGGVTAAYVAGDGGFGEEVGGQGGGVGVVG